MSHFTVIVIGPDVEAQLATFDENREVSPYFVAMSAAAQERVRKQFAEAEQTPPTAMEMALSHEEDEYGERKEGRAVVIDGVPGMMSTSNPDGHWDWWVVGGRWAGFFPVKDGATGLYSVSSYMTADGWVESQTVPLQDAEAALVERLKHATYDRAEVESELASIRRKRQADVVKLGDIDFDTARADADAKARAEFAAWEACFTEHGRPDSWEQVHKRGEGCGAPIEEIRAMYHVQPCIKAWRSSEAGKWGMECPVAYYGFTCDEFAERQRNRRLTPYAIIKNGVWTAKGKMGWFALSDDKATQADWDKYVAELYQSLPPDTLLTLVDCHV